MCALWAKDSLCLFQSRCLLVTPSSPRISCSLCQAEMKGTNRRDKSSRICRFCRFSHLPRIIVTACRKRRFSQETTEFRRTHGKFQGTFSKTQRGFKADYFQNGKVAASPKVSHKRVFTLIRWQPGSANTGFLQHLSHFWLRILGVNSANTLLCDTLALSQGFSFLKNLVFWYPFVLVPVRLSI